MRKDKYRDMLIHQTAKAYFNNETQLIITKDQIKPATEKSIDELVERVGNWLNGDSGLVVNSIANQYLNVVNYVLLKGNHILKNHLNCNILLKVDHQN